MEFTRYSVRGLPERMGVQLGSRGFDQLMAQEKAKKRQARQIFCGQDYGSVCENRYNYCNASVPHGRKNNVPSTVNRLGSKGSGVC
jgi:hypothetical protein